MSSSLNILRSSGFRSFNAILRSKTSPKSLLVGERSSLLKSNILFSNQAMSQKQLIKLPKAVSLEVVRKSSSVSSASSTHWKVERVLSAVLLGLIPACLILENNILDYALAASLVLHSHWGLECIITDYVHGPTLPKMAMGALYVVSALTLAGLFYLNYNDIGITKAVKKIWSL